MVSWGKMKRGHTWHIAKNCSVQLGSVWNTQPARSRVSFLWYMVSYQSQLSSQFPLALFIKVTFQRKFSLRFLGSTKNKEKMDTFLIYNIFSYSFCGYNIWFLVHESITITKFKDFLKFEKNYKSLQNHVSIMRYLIG